MDKMKNVALVKISPMYLLFFRGFLSQGKAILQGLSYLPNLLRYGVFGNSIRLEASDMCQLKCPACPRESRLNKKVIIERGYLKFKDFKKLVDKNRWIRNIELSNHGEIFLNPQLKEIIRYASEKNIALTAGSGVNLNNISEKMIRCLVKYKFRDLLVSIDGASNKTYKIYRKGGDFNIVIDNIKRINFYKKKFNSKYPKLKWQFIIFGHNEHELPLARKMAKDLRMKFLPRLNSREYYSPVKNKEFIKKETGWRYAALKEFKQKYKMEYNSPCYQLWFSPQINWDGKLLGCCANKYHDDFGNVFEKGLKECLKSEKYIYTKKMLLGKEPSRQDIPCYKCMMYKK